MLSEKHAFYSEAEFFFPNTAFSSNEAFFQMQFFFSRVASFSGTAFLPKECFFKAALLFHLNDLIPLFFHGGFKCVVRNITAENNLCKTALVADIGTFNALDAL